MSWRRNWGSSDVPHGFSTATIVAVARSVTHTMRKPATVAIRLLAVLGVEGDAHAGVTVKHRSRVGDAIGVSLPAGVARALAPV
jgi:hypothetical protein